MMRPVDCVVPGADCDTSFGADFAACVHFWEFCMNVDNLVPRFLGKHVASSLRTRHCEHCCKPCQVGSCHGVPLASTTVGSKGLVTGIVGIGSAESSLDALLFSVW